MTSAEETRRVVERYLHGHDATALANDATFEVMSSGQKTQGRAAVEGLLDYFYNRAFTAKYAQKNLTVGEGKAVLEADFYGRQNLEFAGVRPSS